MSYAPQSLRQLGNYWTNQGGVDLGVVGNAAHRKGYHLGRDRIYDGAGPGLGDRDYSVQTARDKRGLTNAASAIDLGRLDRSLPELYRFSRWLVRQCRDNAPGTRDFREVIYSPDGVRVLRWDRQRGYASAPRPGEADDSHLTHTHIGFYRDSEERDKRPVFAPYFAAPPEPEDDDMPVISSYIPGQIGTVRAADGANIRTAPSLTAPLIRTVPAGTAETWVVTGWVKGEAYAGSTDWLVRWSSTQSAWEYVHESNVPRIGPAPDATPFSQADLDAAYARGKAEDQHTVTVTVSDGRAPTVITEV